MALKRPDNTKLIQQTIQSDADISNLITAMLEVLNSAGRSIVLKPNGELIHQMDVGSQKRFEGYEILIKERVEQIHNFYEATK